MKRRNLLTSQLSYNLLSFSSPPYQPIKLRLSWENKDGQKDLQDQHPQWGVTGRESAEKEGWEGMRGNDLWLSSSVFLCFFFQNGKKVKEMEEAWSQVRRTWSSALPFCDASLYKHTRKSGDSLPKPLQNKRTRKLHLSLCLNSVFQVLSTLNTRT